MNCPKNSLILTINGGSSTIKFAVFQVSQSPMRLLSGKIERIGLPESLLTIRDIESGKVEQQRIHAPDHASCVGPLIDLLDKKMNRVIAIGHRVVHGGRRYNQPEIITNDIMAEIRRLCPYMPEHLPSEICLIEEFKKYFPTLVQIACFDTTFHRDMPRVAKLLALPRVYFDAGIERYGFHGLSYSFLMDELAKVEKDKAARRRVILAHLGNGASLAAVRDGKSIDTTMSFTPTAGLPMSTRCGDIDPGIVSYLVHNEGMTIEQFHKMVNETSGLLGISEISSDMRDLLASKKTNPRAKETIDFFCYQTQKYIGGFIIALGGIDTLVFSGGIGENSPEIRSSICKGFKFLELKIDERKNRAGKPLISKEDSKVKVRIIHTDEELQIARSVFKIIVSSQPSGIQE